MLHNEDILKHDQVHPNKLLFLGSSKTVTVICSVMFLDQNDLSLVMSGSRVTFCFIYCTLHGFSYQNHVDQEKDMTYQLDCFAQTEKINMIKMAWPDSNM